MKYLFIAVMFLACNKNLKIQGGDKQNIFLDHISDWAVHESGGAWWADNDYPKWIFGSDKVTKITFPEGYHTLPANDTLPGVCKHIYVSTQPAEVKIEQPVLSHLGGMGVPLPGHGFWRSRESGKKEGQEIVCVKCYHVTRQVLDYGAPVGDTLPNYEQQAKDRGYKLFWHPGLSGSLVTEITAGDCKKKN